MDCELCKREFKEGETVFQVKPFMIFKGNIVEVPNHNKINICRACKGEPYINRN